MTSFAGRQKFSVHRATEHAFHPFADFPLHFCHSRFLGQNKRVTGTNGEIKGSPSGDKKGETTMKSFIISLFAIGLGLAITGSAHAGKPGGNSGGNKSVSKSSPQSFNTMKSSPVKSFSKDSFKCSHFCYSSKYCCNFYWYSDCYYYWCAPRCCYLPITYIETYPPTQVVATTPVISQVVNVQNQNTNGSPGSVQTQADAPAPPAGYGAGAVGAIGAAR